MLLITKLYIAAEKLIDPDDLIPDEQPTDVQSLLLQAAARINLLTVACELVLTSFDGGITYQLERLQAAKPLIEKVLINP